MTEARWSTSSESSSVVENVLLSLALNRGEGWGEVGEGNERFAPEAHPRLTCLSWR